MNRSYKQRHCLALVIALATFIVAIMSFADFSGEPAPRWREKLMIAGPALTVAVLALNFVLDRRK